MRKVFREIRYKLAIINGFFAEHIAGMSIIQVFNRQKKVFDELDKINKDYRDSVIKQIFVFGLFRPSMEVIRSLGVALLIWFGGRGVMDNVLEFGVLFAFSRYLEMFFMPIRELTENYNVMQSAMTSAERVFEIMDTEPEIKDSEEPVEIEEIKGDIEFKNVWFAYEGEDWVLKDVSFKINAGETAAFVGATGSGKTTIINLICRFYDIQKGEILIDGINIKKIPKKVLRKNIGLVLQDVFLFTGDIKSNIKLYTPGITDEDAKKAAEYVNADTFIEKLPDKYDEEVTEKGSTLSTGQRQLLSFARALVHNPRILVLDEATSNIDTYTEELIQQAVAKLIKGRTSIAVAHRLSTIQNADKIIVIHKGRIREIGNHQELLQKKGIYYNLYKLQYEK